MAPFMEEVHVSGFKLLICSSSFLTTLHWSVSYWHKKNSIIFVLSWLKVTQGTAKAAMDP